MAITKLQSESLNLADTYAFTGTVTGAGGVNSPAFMAEITAGTSLSDGVSTKVEMGSEQFDVGGCYNHTSSTATLNGISVPSYSFLPNVAGKYFIGGSIRMNGATDFDIFDIKFGGVTNKRHAVVQRRYNSNLVTAMFEFNGTSDYVHLEAFQVSGSTQSLYNNAQDNFFFAYKIIE